MQEYYWLYKQPGGWNWVSRVPCYVIKRTAKRCTIQAFKRDGSTVARVVKPENLIPAPTMQQAINELMVMG